MSRIYGLNAVEELIEAAPGAVAGVLYAGEPQGAVAQAIERARAAGLAVRRVAPSALRSRSGRRGGASLGADLRSAPSFDLDDLALEPAPLIVALDQVTDPHNLGAVMRSAAAFGAAAVVVTKDRSAPLNDAAVRSSAGAVAYVPLIRVTNLARALRRLGAQGVWTVGTAADGPQTLWDLDLTPPTAIVLGAEGKGLRPNVRKRCDLVAALPLPGEVGSLNVSVTAGIALAEAARQRSGHR
ncbi:MAG: 23S rRNA (guanosine(2251)-2'-O)-methyltransferase RlmB [Deltaproteobacteria bacterium]|nr:MAG: 23S rRNA (guanosine(2251)-2'-O)-methyltransferase RlmB [Deltaproteobacteria bacterium]